MRMVNSICWGLAGPANQAMLIDVSKNELIQVIKEYIHFYNNELSQKRLNRCSPVMYRLTTAE